MSNSTSNQSTTPFPTTNSRRISRDLGDRVRELHLILGCVGTQLLPESPEGLMLGREDVEGLGLLLRLLGESIAAIKDEW